MISMATNPEFIEYVCEQIAGTGDILSKKMFGEYMVYVNSKPILLICDNTVFVKQLDCVKDLLASAERGFPYKGAKEHYVLDIDNAQLAREVIAVLEPVTPLPKPRKKKEK